MAAAFRQRHAEQILAELGSVAEHHDCLQGTVHLRAHQEHVLQRAQRGERLGAEVVHRRRACPPHELRVGGHEECLQPGAVPDHADAGGGRAELTPPVGVHPGDELVGCAGQIQHEHAVVGLYGSRRVSMRIAQDRMQSDVSADVSGAGCVLGPARGKGGAVAGPDEAAESIGSDDVRLAPEPPLGEGAHDAGGPGLVAVEMGRHAAAQLDAAAVTPGVADGMRYPRQRVLPLGARLERNPAMRTHAGAGDRAR